MTAAHAHFFLLGQWWGGGRGLFLCLCSTIKTHAQASEKDFAYKLSRAQVKKPCRYQCGARERLGDKGGQIYLDEQVHWTTERKAWLG